jgi:hypothetical protein
VEFRTTFRRLKRPDHGVLVQAPSARHRDRAWAKTGPQVRSKRVSQCSGWAPTVLVFRNRHGGKSGGNRALRGTRRPPRRPMLVVVFPRPAGRPWRKRWLWSDDGEVGMSTKFWSIFRRLKISCLPRGVSGTQAPLPSAGRCDGAWAQITGRYRADGIHDRTLKHQRSWHSMTGLLTNLTIAASSAGRVCQTAIATEAI